MIKVILLAAVTLCYYVLFKIDPSAVPIQDRTHLPPWAHNKPVVLVSYGDGPEVFKKNQNILTGSAIGKGVDTISSHRKELLPTAFKEKNKAILEKKRGAGYWLWKPYVILEAMKHSPEDSIVVYADSGVIFAKHLYPLFDLLKTHDVIFSGFSQDVPLLRNLKKEAQRLLNIDGNPDVLKSPLLWGAFMVFRNTESNRALVTKWLQACENGDILTDDPLDPKIQDTDFKAHEHDQSVLSVIAAQEKPNAIRLSRKELIHTYGITNYHRHPEEEDASPLFQIAGLPKWISKIFYDNILFNTLRKALVK